MYRTRHAQKESISRRSAAIVARRGWECAQSTRRTPEIKQGPMDKLVIQGGRKLEGTVRISGAKNAALPAMTAALLTAEPVHLHNVPRVRDIVTMGRLLAHMDACVATPEVPSTTYTIRTERVND